MQKFVCIHGHFYQPPRENPWLESIEIQDSAYPFHDWNERITSECYGPNATARILDGKNYIEKIVNNYSRISFNFGATLLSWMENRYPRIYSAIQDADKESQQRFSGHGSALAQVYNHMIMPLANARDKRTQVRWGIQDFLHRFGRFPEGMWLAETAVDTPSLEALAAEGIAFTILAPHQARRIRPIGSTQWQDVHAGNVPCTRPYRAQLPSGKHIDLFFYHGPISRAVAFERLLTSGEHFARRIVEGFPSYSQGPHLMHIATDGETYGHHHRYGDMALAYALQYIERENLAQLTNYGEYLERFPPQYEVEIAEDTAWSCSHGIERWRSDCGCSSGGHPQWHQQWRGPLREALDWLRDHTNQLFAKQAPQYLKDPELARNEYIHVILNRHTAQVKKFLQQHASVPLDADGINEVLKLLEIQRNNMLMYTSCGWFFDEISGIETTQILQYAGRSIQLAEYPHDGAIEEPFLDRLSKAISNVPEYGNGRAVYQKFVPPARVSFSKLAAHYAASSIFEEEGRTKNTYSFSIQEEDYQCLRSGRTSLVLGRVRVQSRITWGSSILSFGVLHLGDHNLTGGVRSFQGEEAYQTMQRELKSAFLRAELPEVMRLLDRHFLEATYSIRTLFRDQQRKVLDQILKTSIEDAQMVARQLYQQHSPLLHYLASLDFPLPEVLRSPVTFVLNSFLKEAFETQPLPLQRIRTLLAESKAVSADIDAAGLSFSYQRTLEQLAERWQQEPLDLHTLRALVEASSLADELNFDVNLYHVQNIFYKLLQTLYPAQLEDNLSTPFASPSSPSLSALPAVHPLPPSALTQPLQPTADFPTLPSTSAWIEQFRALGEALHIRV